MIPKEMIAKASEAKAFWKAGDLGRALEAYREGTSYDPFPEVPTAEQLKEGRECFRIWMAYAVGLEEDGRYREAIVAANRARLCPDIAPHADALRGGCFLDLEEWEEASQAFKVTLEGNPRPGAWTLLSFAMNRQGRFEEGYQCLIQALELDPDYDEAHYNLGCHFVYEEDWKSAETHFRRAIQLDPDYAIAYGQLAWALIHQPDADQDEAEALLRKSLKLDPKAFWARVYLGHLCWRKEQLGEALEHFETLVRFFPQDSDAHTYLGQVLGAAEQEEMSEHHLQRALQLLPDNETALLSYGRLCYRQDRDDEAIDFFRQALELGEEGAQEYLEELESI